MGSQLERYEQSDVNRWGLIAVGCIALAALSAGISGLIPERLAVGLQATRIEGGSLSLLRADVTGLRSRIDRVIASNDEINNRLMLTEQDQGTVTKRVGALEDSLPVLLEQLPYTGAIDRSAVTASTSNDTDRFQVEGGSIEVSTTPLFVDQPMPGNLETGSAQDAPSPATAASTPAQPAANMPKLTRVSSNGFGVSLGDPLNLPDVRTAWRQTHDQIGALLMGMMPLIIETGGGKFKIIAGPLDNVQGAEQLCVRLVRSGVSCRPVSYSGYALPQ